MTRDEIFQAIKAERARQVDVENWSAEHDDGHDRGELARLAAAYCVQASYSDKVQRERAKHGQPPNIYPQRWDWRWWKPKSRELDLIRAAATIVAELERLGRGGIVR